MRLAVLLVLLDCPVKAQERASYRAVEGGRFELTRPLTVQTKLFGPIILTQGFRSDGSSSPIPDTERTRIAGFVHDALYSASGHLRFLDGYPRGWSKKQADDAYCAMLQRGARPWHARANCTAVRRLPWVRRAWNRLKTKRTARWALRATRPALTD